MKVIRNTLIPFKGFAAINICGLVFARKECTIDETTLRHEAIHSEQMKELLYIGFYLLYLAEWVWHIGRCVAGGRPLSEAYWDISFEKEAYGNEADAGYLERRRHYAMWN